MAANMIFVREGEVVDAEAMAQYQSGNRSGGAPAGMKPLVVYGAMETVEGEPADGLVVLEFPDKDAAKSWYYGDDYQERAKFRQAAAPYRAIIAEGL